MTERRVEIGDSFRVGEVWTSPRGKKYIVKDLPHFLGASPSRYVTLETLPESGKVTRRKIQWDAVDGWVRNPDDNKDLEV